MLVEGVLDAPINSDTVKVSHWATLLNLFKQNFLDFLRDIGRFVAEQQKGKYENIRNNVCNI